MRSIRYLIVPGWHGSPDEHWQSHWQRTLPGSARVEQQDWLLPRREDWVAELQRSIAAHAEPVILVAHSLGCMLVAHWARCGSPLKVAGAFLAAPSDVEASTFPFDPGSWAPVPMGALPFPSLVVGSANDPFATTQRTRAFAEAWGSRLVEIGDAGHLNTESGHGEWPDGLRLLEQFCDEVSS